MLEKWIRDTRMGYYSGQAGIMRRMLREEGAWQSHLVKTSEFIQQAVKSQQPKSIRILGSGWLLDVPISYLIDRCEKIILTDITHPNQIVNKYSKNTNIFFETLDITGGAAELCYKQKKSGFNINSLISQLSNIKPIDFSEDMTVSVNLLSQLNITLTDYLVKKIRLTDSQIIAITQTIQSKHLEMLPAEKSLLITDYEEEYYNEDNKLIGSKPTVYVPLSTGKERKEWNWNFDTKMMYKEGCKTVLRVTALKL
jgi:hypothetical protein